MNGATKDILNVASKMMAIGLPLSEVIADMTAHPAHQIKSDELGNLSVGTAADVAVLSIQKGKFGFTDMVNSRVSGNRRLVAELTLKDGRIVYDLNGLSAEPWTASAQNHPGDGTALHWSADVTRLGGLLKAVPAGLIRGAAQRIINDVWTGVDKQMAD